VGIASFFSGVIDMLAMCWKCTHQITEPDVTGMFERLIGCEICAKITDYQSAQKYCPLIQNPEVHMTVPLVISKVDPQ